MRPLQKPKSSIIWGQKFHSSTHNYEWNLERTSNSSQSTCPIGQVLCENYLSKSFYSLMFFIAYTFEGQVHVFAGRVKIVNALVLQDKCNIEIFLSPDNTSLNAWYCWIGYIVVLGKIQLVVSRHFASDNRLSADLAKKQSGAKRLGFRGERTRL